MRVVLRQPRREHHLDDVDQVADLFWRLDLVPESYLAIRDGELLTADMPVEPDDVIELRPVISGGGSA
jgi:sulfur carrier protein